MLPFHQIWKKSKGRANGEITANIWVDLHLLKRKSKTWHNKGILLKLLKKKLSPDLRKNPDCKLHELTEQSQKGRLRGVFVWQL